MMRFLIIIFASAITYFISIPVLAQKKNISYDKIRHYMGFTVEYGDTHMGFVLNANYTYHVILFSAQYHYVLLPKKHWSLNIVVQPQYNLTRFCCTSNAENKMNGFEVGLNAGLELQKIIFRDLISCYLLVSSGPHYVSGVPKRQSAGFIFSDNFFVGFNIKLIEGLSLNLKYGFRHISNASLQQPNGGINNLICGGGLLFNFKTRRTSQK